MKKIALLFIGFAVSHMATAQISITSTTTPYNQNFNTLDTAAATSSSNLPAGWLIKERGTSTTTVNDMYKGGTGSSNAGDAYSFGTSGSNERALGSLASGSNSPSYGARFTNNTGSTVTSITISYRAEQWRSGPSTSGDTSKFFYNLSATTMDSVVTGDVAVPALNLSTIVLPAAPAGPMDGNAAGNFVTKTATITVSIPTGSSILIKWVDVNGFGSDEGLAVDDFTALFNAGPPVPNPILVSMTPADNATGVAPGTNLVLNFNTNVTGMAAGSFRIKNVTDQTTVTKAGNSSDVVVSGSTVTISNVGLVANKNYYVTFDSAAIEAAGFKAYGIYDTTAWNFSVNNVGVTNTVKNELGLSVIGTATSSNINMMYTLPQAGVYTISIVDMAGRNMHTENFNAATGTQTRNITGLNLGAGLYIIRLSNESGVGIAKAIVQ